MACVLGFCWLAAGTFYWRFEWMPNANSSLRLAAWPRHPPERRHQRRSAADPRWAGGAFRLWDNQLPGYAAAVVREVGWRGRALLRL